MNRARRLVAIALLLAGCAAPASPTASPPPPTASPSQTPTPTLTLTLTLTPTPPHTQIPTSTPTPTQTQTLASHLIIISIDGLRPDALLQADAPNIIALAHRGAYTWQAQTTFPPATLPSHASMLTGYALDGHGVTWNDYRPNRSTLAPTIFAIAHEAGLRTVMVVGKQKMQLFAEPGTVDSYTFATEGDRSVADAAIAEIENGFDLMFIHLPNVDFFGHSTGWMSETYITRIAQTDEAVGRILDALPEDTTVILTADHGGHGIRHGANTPEDMTIPWMIVGTNVVIDHELESPVVTTDTAATALYVLGLSLPPDADGQLVTEAFGIAITLAP